MSFQSDIDKWASKVRGGIKTVVKSVRFEVVKGVVMNTPVDTGRARANWQSSIGAPVAGFTTSEDKSGQSAINAGVAVASDNIGESFYIVNNLPYIRKLEYGGYPNPPKSNTGKTIGGFSSQAPQGMVRVTVRNVEAAVAVIAANI